MSSVSFRASANGRVNLIGEHTDYNGGWVLPTAIPQCTEVKLTLRTDRNVICGTSQRELQPFAYELGSERKLGHWADYIQGATWVLLKEGHRIGGFELEVRSSVPIGSGLSSSAALEIALFKALRQAFELDLDDRQIALLGQRIENEFVGAQVGIMDQMACSFARYGEAFFLDTKTLEHERFRLPLEKMDLIVINSGISHRITDGGYNQRRSECEAACAELGVGSLRELGPDDLGALERIPAVLRRRARHVITENQRVHKAVAAFRSGDLDYVGRLFYESHTSMRDDYQVSIPEIDILVELLHSDKRVFGARLTGGGFGGSVVAIAPVGQGKSIAAEVQKAYERVTGVTAQVLVPINPFT